MYKFEIFSNEKSEEWDQFIAQKSINGTFLHSRRFLSYHPKERFMDCSIMVYNKKNNLVAVIPACEIDENGKRVFSSHKGSTFGGIVIDRKHYNAKHLIPLMEDFLLFLKKSGYQKVVIKLTPNIFSTFESELFQYLFWKFGFEESKELSTYIDFSRYKKDIISNFAQGKRTNVHNCVKEQLVCRSLETEEEITLLYDILCENLAIHDTRPVHSIEELLDFKDSRLSKEVGFFGVYKEEKMLSCSMMFYFEKARTAHTQYLAAKQEYNKLSPMTFMYYSMILEMRERGFERLSWGTSTEENGRFLNMGLTTSKEDFGSTYSNNFTYTIVF